MKYLLILLTICLLQLGTAGELKNIEYSLNLSFVPYCVNNVCTNTTIFVFDNQTNVTTNYTRQDCSSVCYGKVTITGVDNNQFFSEMDLGLDKWRNGTSELRYGYKSADLGNLSDISGIRQELQNLTTCFDGRISCVTNLTTCQADKSNLESKVSDRDSIFKQLNDWNSKKWIWAIVGVVLGFLGGWKGLPLIQGNKNPRDPTEQFPSNVPYR